MTKFLIASHGKLAEGLYDTFVMVMGKNENLSFFGAYTKAEEDMEESVRKYVDGIKEGDELIVLTDVFGGSVNNEFMKYLSKSNIHLIAGVNLPLLFELIMNLESENTVQMIENAIQNAKEQLQYCNPLIQCSITEENF